MSSAPRTHLRSWAALTWAAIALHALLTLSLALARYASVHHHTFDLALYARMAWGLARGQTGESILGGDFWGGHVAFVLWPLGWLGRLTGSTVPVLLCAQSVAVAVAAWPVYRFAERRLGARGGAAAALAYLLYPNLGHVASYEFHPGTLALWPLCAALDALDRRKPRAVAAWSAAALACRASLGLQTAVIGALALRQEGSDRRARRVALATAIGSAVYVALWTFWLQPRFAGGAGGSADLHYGHWGGSPLGVVPALFRDPLRVAAHFVAIERLRYPLLVLLPLGLLPLAAPRYLLVALPPLALNLLSQFPTASTLYSHYLTPAVPGLVFAAVEGLCTVRARWAADPRARRLGPWVLAATGALASVAAGGLPWSLDFVRSDFHADAATLSRRKALASIPEAASVQAPDPLLPHLAQREQVSRVPPPDRHAEFVVLDVSHRRRFAQREDLLRTLEEPLVRSWLARDDYGVASADDALLVLRRGLSPRAGRAHRYFAGFAPAESGRALTACLALRGARLSPRALTLELVARAACPADLAIRFGADSAPARVDLMFDGLLSPAQLARGDLLRSTHALSAKEHDAITRRGLYVGVVSASGDRPSKGDPIAIPSPLSAAR
jgi:uncharacterized membrane protein